MRKQTMIVVAVAAVLSGCFTVHETERPAVTVQNMPPGDGITVQIAGFEASFVSYTPIYGYTTITGYDWPLYGGYRYCRGGFRTAILSTTEYIPKVEKSTFFLDRATDLMEHAGCILQTASPRYRVEVRFIGPFSESGDSWARVGWVLFSLLTADFNAQEWNAKLKIHDTRTGRLVYERDFSQRYEAIVWGLIPIFSPLFSDNTDADNMKMWCLTALTDIAVADALRFLSTVN